MPEAPAPPPGPLDSAQRRLEGAVARLEARLEARLAARPGPAADRELGEAERARLQADLEGARARERQLEQVASEASAALGRAAAEVRAALSAEV